MKLTLVLTVISCYFLLCSECIRADGDGDVYQVGLGMADITGPVAEVNFMGYAKIGQDGSGIHLRLYSRAFYIQDSNGSCVLYINCDIQSIDQLVRKMVLNKLSETYGKKFDESNVMIAATHTHSGPGGYLQYLLFTILSRGFNKQSTDAVVDGIVESVHRAHANIIPSKLLLTQGQVKDASVNRSPASYLLNPPEERAKYSSDVDTTMYLVKFIDANNMKLRAIISWFPVHPVSMNNTNTLVSSDNKGLASLIVEHVMNNMTEIHGPSNSFIASFSNMNAGDVSPNTRGPRCIDTGEPCDYVTSTCSDGKSAKCIAFGPGRNMEESTYIIAEKQASKALELIHDSSHDVAIAGPVSHVHEYVDMSSQSWYDPVHKTNFTTCPHALGYSFAAGTTDGPGAFDFFQGQRNSTTLWNVFRNFLGKPDQQMIECHYPKPILLATGRIRIPYAWAPSILPTQVIRIGQLVLVGIPGEPTTMAGRRIVKAVTEAVESVTSTRQASDITVIPHGYVNGYSDYIATYEEYQLQRYEGANTAYGPRTLDAYMRQFAKLARGVFTDTRDIPFGPEPPFMLKQQISWYTDVILDRHPILKKFGQVIEQPHVNYTLGETVVAQFVGAHPNNNILPTYLSVEKLSPEDATWKLVATDASFNTKFHWKRDSTILALSTVTIEFTPNEEGVYRINYFGTSRSLIGKLTNFTGRTRQFTVTEN